MKLKKVTKNENITIAFNGFGNDIMWCDFYTM